MLDGQIFAGGDDDRGILEKVIRENNDLLEPSTLIFINDAKGREGDYEPQCR